MELKSGAILQLESNKLKKRVFSKLIGAKEGKYYIISSPKISDQSHSETDIESNFPPNSKLILRSLYGGAVYGFESTIIKIIHDPDILIFIEYPDEIEIYNLRKEKRIVVNIPAKIIISNENYTGTLTNLSNDGCLVCIDSNIQKLKQILTIDKLIYIKFTDPQSAIKYEIDCIIKNKNMENGKLEVGFSFDEMDISLRTQINQLINKINQ
ncbi:MAG: flagellar brake protein [Candidatus Cloacimonadota bacterium]|nr:flagellar brake protein [Candidatus Cloacimonadota bacterium]